MFVDFRDLFFLLYLCGVDWKYRVVESYVKKSKVEKGDC